MTAAARRNQGVEAYPRWDPASVLIHSKSAAHPTGGASTSLHKRK